MFPGLPTPTVSFENVTYDEETDVQSVMVSVFAEDSPVYYLTFNGTLVGWSLTDTVPKKGSKTSGYLYVEDGYGILRRTMEGDFHFRLDFQGRESHLFRLFTNYFVLSSDQRLIIDDLPDWAQVWSVLCHG